MATQVLMNRPARLGSALRHFRQLDGRPFSEFVFLFGRERVVKVSVSSERF